MLTPPWYLGKNTTLLKPQKLEKYKEQSCTPCVPPGLTSMQCLRQEGNTFLDLQKFKDIEVVGTEETHRRKRLPREAEESPPLKAFQTHLDAFLCNGL